MFSSNNSKGLDVSEDSSQVTSIDKLTLWLIRLACIFIILFFSGILLGVPLLLSLLKTQYINFSLGIKELIKSSLEIYLS